MTARKQLLAIALLGGSLGVVIGFLTLARCFPPHGHGGTVDAAILIVLYRALWVPWGLLTIWTPVLDNKFVFAIVFFADGATWLAAFWLVARIARKIKNSR
jgi:hypothetical protein